MKNTNTFLTSLASTAAEESISITENGAVGNAQSGHSLTDFFFAVGSMRSWTKEDIQTKFSEVYAEDKERALELMFFIRDCRGGQGEKRVFEAVFEWVIKNDPQSAVSLLSLVPEYGSWKSFFELTPYFLSASAEVRSAANDFFLKQWQEDYDNLCNGKPISLLGKWCPSENASSNKTRKNAAVWRDVLGLTSKEYRKALSQRRAYLKVLETKMSAGQWSEINYNQVPSKAGVLYRGAFHRHDEERYQQWIDDVKSGVEGAKINTGTLDCPTIVSKYCMKSGYWSYDLANAEDDTLEIAWKDMVKKGRELGINGFIPVVDGSGSMYSQIPDAGIMAYHVAAGLGLYFAAINAEPWRGKVIEFGSHPRFYNVATDGSLLNQLKVASKYSDCGTTNLEAVFDLVLQTAVRGHLKQDEIPGIIIFSDCEFNMMCQHPTYHLMKGIANKYEAYGYKLPKLIFWNVNSRTNTIPLIQNDLGVGLLSGFNQSILKMVMTGKLDPYEILIEQLDNPRYDLVRKALGQ